LLKLRKLLNLYIGIVEDVIEEENRFCQTNPFVKDAATQSTNVHADAHTATKQFSANAALEQEPQQADEPPKHKQYSVA